MWRSAGTYGVRRSRLSKAIKPGAEASQGRVGPCLIIWGLASRQPGASLLLPMVNFSPSARPSTHMQVGITRVPSFSDHVARCRAALVELMESRVEKTDIKLEAPIG